MRISVNLATRPFVELRPLFARLRLAMGLLLLLAVGLFFASQSLSAKAKVAGARMDGLVNADHRRAAAAGAERGQDAAAGESGGARSGLPF